jgi:hypothetical protein
MCNSVKLSRSTLALSIKVAAACALIYFFDVAELHTLSHVLRGYGRCQGLDQAK